MAGDDRVDRAAAAAFRPWRTRRYAGTLALALLVAAPLLIAWPMAMYCAIPLLFALWRDGQSIARFFGLAAGSPPVEPFYYLKNLPWFAWPALPLALWTLWLRCARLQRRPRGSPASCCRRR